MMPKILKTKSGKRYFVIRGRKIFLNGKMSKKEISSLYKLGKTKMKKRNRRTKQHVNSNKAYAVININKKQSPIDPRNRFLLGGPAPNQVTLHSSSGNQDLTNSLINKLSKNLDKP